MPAFHIDITTGANTPIYRQIVDQVRLAVATGALLPGQPLPSVRALAERLVINPNTVSKAYGELVRDGVLEARPGRGLFVAERRQVFSRAERTRRLRQALDTFTHEAVSLGFTAEEIHKAVEDKLTTLDLGGGAAGGKP